MAPAVAEHTTVNLVMLALKELKPSPLNPRKHFDAAKLEELAATMGNGRGIIEPLIGRQVKDHVEVIAGARRLRAAVIAKLEEVPVILKNLTDAEVLETMVVENDAREDMTPLERADGYRRLLKLGTLDVPKLALRIGRSRSWVYDVMKLDELIPEAKQLLEDGRITMGHGVLLTRLTAAEQKQTIDPVHGGLFEHEPPEGLFAPEDRVQHSPKGDKYHDRIARSVRELEGWINEHVRLDLKSARLEELFPEVASVVEQAETVVHITFEHYLGYGRSDVKGVVLKQDWKRADGIKGSKTCPSAQLGVVVVGGGRGQAFKVCVDKTCAVHFPKPKANSIAGRASAPRTSEAEKKRRAAEEARWKAKRAKEEAERKRWTTARPAIGAALAAKLATAKLPALVAIVGRGMASNVLPAAVKAMGKMKTADDALRVFAYAELAGTLQSDYGRPEFEKQAKKLGLDLKALLKVQSIGKAKPSAKASKKR